MRADILTLDGVCYKMTPGALKRIQNKSRKKLFTNFIDIPGISRAAAANFCIC